MTTATADSPLTRTLRFMGDYPLVPLVILLFLLIGLLELMNPGVVNQRWLANTIKVAIPLAMLAACQTLTMLTGGIDLSAGTVATISAYVMATLVPHLGVAPAIAIAMGCALVAGLVNGFGVAVARVHPLIMTLGTGLIAMGCLLVYQRFVIATGNKIPDFLLWLGIGRTFGLPNGLFLFVPFAALIIWAQRRTGFGRLLYAIGSNERAARLSGVRSWQVFFGLYALSSLIAGLTGLVQIGIVKTPSLSLDLPSVAAAVIGGTSIFGGRGGYGGTILGALILTVLATMLTLLQMPEGARRIIFGLIILAVTAAYIRLTLKE